MRTPEQIREKILNTKSMFGFEIEVWAEFLPFEYAESIAKTDVTKEEWDSMTQPLTREAVLASMLEYMDFAIGKAIDHRGISAGRSVEKMEAWIWLLEDDPIDAAYQNYGAPILRAICERYDWDWRAIAEEHWGLNAFERMSQSLPCRDDCNEGCG